MNATDATIIIAILGAAATICVPAITKYYEHKNILKKEIRDRKIEAYEKIIDFFIDNLLKFKGIKRMDEEENPHQDVLAVADITRNLINYGSSDVIIKWNIWRCANHGIDNTLPFINDLFLAIRKDIGYDDNFKNKNELLQLLITEKYNSTNV